jgi:flagellar basal-body rod protein FlgG
VFASGDHQHGATLAGARLDHTPGRIVETGGPLDLAIDGEGFFVVREGDQTWFTRSGRLRIGPQGRLMLGESGSAYALDPPIQVPTGTEQITISADGRVAARGLNAAEATELGRIELALFLEPTRLAARSDSLFELTPESGPAHLGQPATDGRGALRQACLEQSNVRLRHELSELRRLEAQLDAIARTPVGYPPISKRGPEVPRDISGQLGE